MASSAMMCGSEKDSEHRTHGCSGSTRGSDGADANTVSRTGLLVSSGYAADLKVVCKGPGSAHGQQRDKRGIRNAKPSVHKISSDSPQSVTMFLCPCEIALRTLISFRICHVRVKQNGFPISLIETWPGENGRHPGEVETFELWHLSRSSTHHVLPTRHETLVDNLQRDTRHQPSEVAIIPERHPEADPLVWSRVARLTLHA